MVHAGAAAGLGRGFWVNGLTQELFGKCHGRLTFGSIGIFIWGKKCGFSEWIFMLQQNQEFGFVFWVICLLCTHGKSLLNQHLGEYVFLFPTTFFANRRRSCRPAEKSFGLEVHQNFKKLMKQTKHNQRWKQNTTSSGNKPCFFGLM